MKQEQDIKMEQYKKKKKLKIRYIWLKWKIQWNGWLYSKENEAKSQKPGIQQSDIRNSENLPEVKHSKIILKGKKKNLKTLKNN